MLRSSDASRQSSDDSEPVLVQGLSWLERRVAPFAQRFGNAPAVLALRDALPISFGGLLIALAVLIVFFEPGAFTPSGLADRLKLAIPGAFAVMSIVLLLVLALRLAQRLALPILAVVAAAACAFGFALPRAAWKSFTVLAATLGTSGLFTAIVCGLAAAGAIVLTRGTNDAGRTNSPSRFSCAVIGTPAATLPTIGIVMLSCVGLVLRSERSARGFVGSRKISPRRSSALRCA